ncbi:MAG TPA: MlaD family protein [Steroidobacteraceae bacterium]|nr:MlaD family protein [Steroidobacteraceae bacterium]
MSGPEQRTAAPRRMVSDTHRSWWPGWIWGIPVAAIAIVVWLVLRAVTTRGVPVTIAFEQAEGLKAGDSKVVYRGLAIGEVRSLSLDADGLQVTAHVDIDRDAAKFLRADTHFYLQPPSLSDPSSLKGIIGASAIEMLPGDGAASRHFKGEIGKPPETLRVKLPYLVMLDGDTGGLQRGTSVKLRGFTVGEVIDVRLTVDATGAISTPVLLALDPTRFHIQGLSTTGSDWRRALDATLAELIHRGLRARLTQDPPLLGALGVALEIERDAAPATLLTGERYPQIPASSNRGLAALATEAGEIPLAQIGRNVRAFTARLDTLVSSPELHDSIAHLDRTLAEVDRDVAVIGPRLPPTIASVQSAADNLRKAAAQIEATAAVAKRAIGSRGSEQGANVQDALRELTEAARAARSLANELDDRPESLIRGR